jgi:glycosyltransferase involved in cell wall biosynthesis
VSGVYRHSVHVVVSAHRFSVSATFGMDARPRTDRLSLVIPAFNEAEVIVQAVREAETTLAGLFARYEVLVVDDGSTDDTAHVVEQLLPKTRRTRLLRHPGNRGYGAALRTGFEAARYNLVAFTDADCQFDLADLGPLAALAAEFPIVAGYRADRKDPWKRRFFSWGYNRLARTLLGTGLRDVDCALKIFRRDVLGALLPRSRGFFVNTEMISRARRLGLAIAEAPVTHRPRARGASKVSLREIPRTAWTLLRFWWREVVWRSGTRCIATPVFQGRMSMGGRQATTLPSKPPV